MYTANIYWDAMGVTQSSLKNLRNELAERINSQLTVLEWSSDDKTFGYVIIDHTTQEVILTGNGFRNDGGGEGGAGMVSARALIKLFGLSVLGRLKFNEMKFYSRRSDQESFNLHYAREVVDKLEKNAFLMETSTPILSELKPQYLR